MAVSGYPSRTSVRPGESIGLHLAADPPRTYTMTVLQAPGAEGSASASFNANLGHQREPGANAWEGFGWSVSHTFAVPSDWPSGLYYLLDDERRKVTSFVVRSRLPGQRSTILLHIPYLTLQAYNAAGGKSLYGFSSLPSKTEADRAVQVSFDRPGAVPGIEESLIGWLLGEGIEIECCSSVDLHTDPDLLFNYECLVMPGHDEYWTREMRERADRFVANGGNIICLSGNSMYRQVRLERDNHMVVFQKYASADPEPDNSQVSVAFGQPPVNNPQNRLLGTGFTWGAFQQNPWLAYSIRFPSHWVFERLDPVPDETSAFMHYETDAAAFVEDEGYPRVTGEEGTPLTFTVLATADLRSSTGKPGMATMGIYRRGGTVFNAASTDWCEALGPHPGPEEGQVLDPDDVVIAVTRTVFERLSRRRPFEWEIIGRADEGRAMASLDARLFLVASDRLWRRHPVGANVPWREIGDAEGIVSLAGGRDTLFGVNEDNDLLWRPPVEQDAPWTPLGSGPGDGTAGLAAACGLLWAVDGNGKLFSSPTTREAPEWSEVGPFAGTDDRINALTSHSDILIASTSDGRMLRSNRDLIYESSDWVGFIDSPGAIGLGVIEGTLFAATSEGELFWLDLHGLRQP
jgi:hypothetical protein